MKKFNTTTIKNFIKRVDMEVAKAKGNYVAFGSPELFFFIFKPTERNGYIHPDDIINETFKVQSEPISQKFPTDDTLNAFLDKIDTEYPTKILLNSQDIVDAVKILNTRKVCLYIKDDKSPYVLYSENGDIAIIMPYLNNDFMNLNDKIKSIKQSWRQNGNTTKT